MIRLLYFAAARELARTVEERIDLPPKSTVRDLLALVAKQRPELARILPHLQVAVDRRMAAVDSLVPDGAEVALIPPVAGGAGRFWLTEAPLRPSELVDQAAREAVHDGAVVTFCGQVRGATSGRRVLRLEYEAYGPMAVECLESIGAQATERWPGSRLTIAHRTGTLHPGDVAVVIAATAPHRAEAFEACRYAIEALKQEVPIWKKEIFEDGGVWVGLGP